MRQSRGARSGYKHPRAGSGRGQTMDLYREQSAEQQKYAIKIGNTYGVPVDTARKLLGNEAVKRSMDRYFAGLYWNVHEDARGTVTYLTMLGFKRAAQWAGKFDINKL